MEKRFANSDFRLNSRPSSVMPSRSDIFEQQKRLRSAHADRYSYADEAKALVKKHRSKMEFLIQESKALKDGVITMFQKNFVRNMSRTESDREEAKVRMRAEIEEEEGKLGQIEANIKIFEKQIISMKQRTGGANNPIEIQQGLIKDIKILENRLDKATQKFNDLVTINSGLRLEIDSFRKERTMFQM